jgi:hypothetical protein
MATERTPLLSAENAKPHGVSSWIKVFLAILPLTLVVQIYPHGHHVLRGTSMILGALLQALCPPHGYRFWWMLGGAIVAAVIIPIVSRLLG